MTCWAYPSPDLLRNTETLGSLIGTIMSRNLKSGKDKGIHSREFLSNDCSQDLPLHSFYVCQSAITLSPRTKTGPSSKPPRFIPHTKPLPESIASLYRHPKKHITYPYNKFRLMGIQSTRIMFFHVIYITYVYITKTIGTIRLIRIIDTIGTGGTHSHLTLN